MNIRLGQINTLRVVKQVPFGYYLDGGRIHGEVLLPQNEVEGDVAIGQEVEVFLYLDQEERLIATMRKPQAQVGDFAFLEVAWVNNFGAFLGWGLMKDLFVPFREQKMKMVKGQSYIVHIHLDEDSNRIMASAKVERYLSKEMPSYEVGQEVDVMVWQKTDLGYKVIVENRFSGLLYRNEVFQMLEPGMKLQAFVKQIRPDGKIDLTTHKGGAKKIDSFVDTLLEYIKNHDGYTTLNDKSDAEEIYATFGVSKKVFKKAVGDLYKRRLVVLEEGGIRLA